jgi:hypothetical protein
MEQVKGGWMTQRLHVAQVVRTILQAAHYLPERRKIHVIEPFRQIDICGRGLKRLTLRRTDTRPRPHPQPCGGKKGFPGWMHRALRVSNALATVLILLLHFSMGVWSIK